MRADLGFGVGLFPTEPLPAMVELARLAERLGYGHVWIGDSHLIWREAYVTLAAAAAATGRVVLGTSVTNLVTRDPAVVASTFATLHEAWPGRVILGAGLGDSAVETMGRKPSRLAAFESDLRRVRSLLAGDEVPTDTGTMRLKHAPGAGVPIYVAGSGPRILELAGRVADGVIVLVGVQPDRVRRALERVHAGARAAGRDPGGLDVVLWVPCAVSGDEGEARDAVKAHVARAVNRPLPFELDDAERRVVAEIRGAYDYARHMDRALRPRPASSPTGWWTASPSPAVPPSAGRPSTACATRESASSRSSPTAPAPAAAPPLCARSPRRRSAPERGPERARPGRPRAPAATRSSPSQPAMASSSSARARATRGRSTPGSAWAAGTCRTRAARSARTSTPTDQPVAEEERQHVVAVRALGRRRVDADAVVEPEEALGALAPPDQRVEGRQQRAGAQAPGRPGPRIEVGGPGPPLHTRGHEIAGLDQLGHALAGVGAVEPEVVAPGRPRSPPRARGPRAGPGRAGPRPRAEWARRGRPAGARARGGRRRARTGGAWPS